MNAFANKIVNDDFLWDAIISRLPKTIKSNTDFLRFNCPVCHLHGEGRDKKMRGGLRRNADGLGLFCFNCGFRSKYVLGEPMPRKVKDFLHEIGFDELEINRMSFKAFELSKIVSRTNMPVANRAARFVPNFETVELPAGTKTLTEWAQEYQSDNDFLNVASYALERGPTIVDHAMWSPDAEWRDRMIIPFYFKGNIIGWTGRSWDETSKAPKYMSRLPTDYLYNCDILEDRNSKYVLMPEGVLDARAINGISPLGAKLSQGQADWINDTGKTVIVIPDRDTSGQRLVDAALKHGWRVAFPHIGRGSQNWWEANCKDSAEAVKRYGRLYVIRSIIESSTDRPLEINVRRKWLTE